MNFTNTMLYGGLIDDTSSLVGPACDGILEWLTDLIDINSFIYSFFDDFGYDKDLINGYFVQETLNNIKSASVFAGLIVALCLFALHMVLVNMNFASDSSQKQTIIDLIIRLPIAVMLAFLIPSVLSIVDNLVDSVLKQAFYQITPETLLQDNLSLFLSGHTISSMFSTVINVTFGCIILVVLWIAIIIEIVKFLIEVAERTIVVWVLDFFSPLAAGTYVSRTTSGIFTNYLRMYVSQSVLVILNHFFIILFIMACMNTTEITHIKYLIFLLALLKTAQRVDSHLKSLGLTVAQTGSALLDSIGMATAGVASLLKSAKTGVGIGGSVLAARGAATGDLGMAIVGNDLTSLAKGNLANLGHEKGVAAAQTRGIFKNAGLQNAATIKEAVAAAKSGNYRPINELKSDVRSHAIREALGTDGMNSIRQQTGLDLNNAKNLSINGSNGDISGIVSMMDKDGKVKDIAFKTSSTPINTSSKQIAGINGTSYITPIQDGKPLPGFKTEGTRLMSSVTGADLSLAEKSDVPISRSEYMESDGKGYIMHYGDTDEGKSVAVGLSDVKTGEFYSMGTNCLNENITTPSIEIDDIALCDSDGKPTIIKKDGLLGGYDFGSDAKILQGSLVPDPNSKSSCHYDFKVHSNTGTYDVQIAQPVFCAETLIENRKSVHVTHLSHDRGDAVCRVRKES